MPTLFLGLVVLVLLFLAAKWFSKADSKQSARVLRYVGGGAALLLAGFLLVRGQIAAALSIGLLGGAHRKPRVKFHACAPLFWKWNSNTTAAPCAVGS
jgi:hypothetical protein